MAKTKWTAASLRSKIQRSCVLALLLVGVATSLMGCGQKLDAGDPNRQLGPNEVRISRQTFGDAWPFTVDEGILAGYGRSGVGQVVFTTDGATYAVNGTAAKTGAYDSIDAIRADDPSKPGAKKDLGPIIDRGLQLCP